jgi:hypothetical protein
MSILRDLIDKMKTNDATEQIRILTEQIFTEETPQMKYIDFRPQGANIFLALQVPGHTKKEVGFLCLERETEDLWIASYWTIPEKLIEEKIEVEEKEAAPRKKKVIQINDHRPEKIVTEYAKLFKFYNGE